LAPAGFRPYPLGSLHRSPRSSSWIKGSLLLREGDGREWIEVEGRKWRGKGERRESEGRGHPFMDRRYAPAVA